MHDSSKGLCLFHPNGHLARPNNPFGKDIANAALFRALVEHGKFSDIAVLNGAGLSSAQLASGMGVSPNVRLTAASLSDTALPAAHGTLLRGQPYIAELAWLRRCEALDPTYSIIGLIHTIAPPAVRSEIGDASLAPIHHWDALICTSPAIQKSMGDMFDAWAEHLGARLGAVRAPRPQFPLIPLAVDTERLKVQASDKQARVLLRKRLGIADDDVVVLWVGRLSYYEKAFPQSMFQAVQMAARSSRQRLHFCLVGWFPGGNTEMEAYKEAADLLSPDLNVIVLDGNDPNLVAQSWAAADIFLSLVDNIQETFGLTPVEAMAAGMPVVVSDWDGYRYTVRDGIDGFLVPTLGSPGGAHGELLANLHTLKLETYQTYVGATAQHTAIHIQKAAAAISRLANDPNQRRKMGNAAQKRAQTMFSWPEVVRLYRDLFAELSERRDSADPALATAGARIHPHRGEPFTDFQHFATDVLHAKQTLRLADDVTAADLEGRLKVRLNRQYPGLRCDNNVAQTLLQKLEVAGSTGLTVQQLFLEFGSEPNAYLSTTVVWLAKMGLIEWEQTHSDS